MATEAVEADGNKPFHGYFFRFGSNLFSDSRLSPSRSQNVQSSADQVLNGNYSCKFTSVSVSGQEGTLSTIDLPVESSYRNILVFFSIFVEVSPNPSSLVVRASFSNGTSQQVEVELDEGGKWATQKSASIPIPSGATSFSLQLILPGIYHSSSEAIAYVDNLGIYAQSAAIAAPQTCAIFSDTAGTLAAHDLADGRQVWQFETAYGFLTSKPTVVDDVAYFGDGDTVCNIYALHAEAGTKKWVTGLPGSIDATPEVTADTVYIGTSTGKLYEIDKASGTKRAEYDILRLAPGESAKIYSNQLIVRTILITSQKGVFGFDINTKQITFSQPLAYAVDTVPAVRNGIAYYGDLQGYFYAVDFRNDQSLWRVQLGGAVHASPQLVGNLVIVGCDAGRLVALDIASGRIVSELTKQGNFIRSFKVASDRLYVSYNAIQGQICAYKINYDANAAAPGDAPDGDPEVPLLDDSVFTQLWCFDINLGVERDPLVIGNQVCFASNDHHCYCVDADSGTQIWNVATPIPGFTEPAFVPAPAPPPPSRRFDQYCYLTSHNSFAYFAYGWWLGNQELGLTEQLDYGVRGLMLDTHKVTVDGQPRIVLYHETQWSDYSWFFLKTAMREIGDWMKNNPGEVVAIQFQNRQRDPTLTAQALSAAGVSDMIFDPSKTNTGPGGESWGPVLQNGWPTVDWMVRNNKRLVLFAERTGDGIPYVWQYTVETWYGSKSMTGSYAERDESANIPLSKNRSLYTVNLFPDIWYALPLHGYASYNSLNSFDSLIARADVCKFNPRFDTDPSLGWERHLPNLLAVDFVTRGDNGGPLRAVEELNAFWADKA